MCGGPSSQQKAAASSQASLDNELTNLFQQGSAVTTPFHTNLVKKGLPYFNQQSQYGSSNVAQQINQAKANQAGRLAGFGKALPSGAAEADQQDLSEAGAQMFNQNIMNLLNENYQAQLAGAEGLNPLGEAAAAQGGNASIMNAPLQNSFWSNLIGGLVQGTAQVA